IGGGGGPPGGGARPRRPRAPPRPVLFSPSSPPAPPRGGGGGSRGGTLPAAHRVGRLGLDLLLELVAEHAEPAEVALVAAQALVRTLLLDSLEIDVGLRGVRPRT